MQLKYFTILSLLFVFSCSSKSQEQQVVSEDEQPIEVLQPKSYSELKKEALAKREILAEAYTKNKSKRDSIIAEAQQYLLTVSDDFFRAWYNTPWTFH